VHEVGQTSIGLAAEAYAHHKESKFRATSSALGSTATSLVAASGETNAPPRVYVYKISNNYLKSLVIW
jgi:hypothetical protein